MKRWAALGSEMFVVGIGQAGGLIASVAVTKILTSSLGDEQYGQFALAMTVPLLLQQLVFGPVGQAGLRFYPEHAASGRLRTLFDVLLGWLRRTAYAAAMTGTALAVALWGLGLPTWSGLLLLAIAAGLAQNYQALFGILQSAARRRVAVALHQMLEPAARALCIVALVYSLGARTLVAAAGAALGSGVALVSQYLWFRRTVLNGIPSRSDVQPAERTQIAAALWVYGANFVVWGLFAWMQQASDRWALKAFVGDEAVGIYAAAYQLASVPTILAGAALSQFLFPIVFGRAGDGTSSAAVLSAARIVHVTVAAFLAWVMVAVAICWIAGTEILVLLTSEAFRSGGAILPMLAAALGLMQLGHLLALVPLSAKDLAVYRWLKIGHAIVAVAASAWGALAGGLWGVAVASLVSAAAYGVSAAVVNVRILGARRVALAQA
jgi:O-antigen/teichoic acid export membrane protein